MSAGSAAGRRFRPVHWAGRFLRSLGGGPPDPVDVEWAMTYLSPAEVELFGRMSNPDKRHAVGVARAAAAALAEDGAPELTDDRRRAVMAMAVLHDVGKTISGLRTYGRVVATLSGLVGGADMAEVWQQTSGFTRRVGLYLRYPELGAELLEVRGADPWVVAWSREHHELPETWTVPREVGELLVRCDS